MIVTNVNGGTKAEYSLNGTNLTVSVPEIGDLTIDLADKQQDIQRNVDVSLDRNYSRVVEGVGSWYVASIEIPPVATELSDTGEVDENGDPVMERQELPLDVSLVKLRLWRLPESISNPKEATE